MEINSLLAEQSRRPSQGAPPQIASRPPDSQITLQSYQASPQSGPPPEAKQSRSRKKEQPILQHPTPPSRAWEHQFSHYTPPGHHVVPAPRPQPPHTNLPSIFYPVNPAIGGRRMSGPPAHPQNGDYRHQLAPAPTNAGRSPPDTIGRRDSTGYDYLADIAARQHLQHQQQQAARLARNSISREPIRSPAAGSVKIHTLVDQALPLTSNSNTTPTPPVTTMRNGSISAMSSNPGGPTTPTELTIGDPPTLQPRQFTAPSISAEDLQTITDLTKKLAEKSYLYDVHIQLVNLLHQGFIAHVFPPSNPEDFQEPNQYPLVAELRQARNAMDSRFPVGEALWKQWIEDECMLARSVEDRVSIMELCQKAVQEEVGSTKLWRLYGDWMWLLYKITHDIFSGGYQLNTLENHPVVSRVLERRRWTEDEKVVGKEIFSWNPMLDVWIHGMKAVECHIDDSDVVWDPYVQILSHDLARNPSADKVKHVWTLFAERLQKPHASWQATFQGFSQFVSQNYDESIYEETMIAANKQSARSKKDFDLRQDYEHKLQRAAGVKDQVVEYTVLSEYLEWELDQFKESKHKKTNATYAFELYIALLERANLRFPTASAWWEDHVDLVMEYPKDSSSDLLALVHRASRHCPWSGSLWSKHLLAFEAAEREFVELEDIKHRATSTGLLEELGGMDELITVYTAWCGFLRRRAFGYKAGEDERDVAEMGIRSVMENVKDIGVRKYGKDFKGDPAFRAERMYVKFLSQSNRDDEARETWTRLIGSHGDLAEFWDKYYLWEMITWAKRHKDLSIAPEHATNVLRQAIRRPNLNEPEKIVDMYLHHCGQHESIEILQKAQTEARRATKVVLKRRAQEAAEAAETAAQHAVGQPAVPEPEAMQVDKTNVGKRKRDDQANDFAPSKRAKSEDVAEQQQHPYGDASTSETSQVKRDRENATAIVKKLPYDTTEVKVRKFFRDCGEILNLQLVQEDKDKTTTATIEFGTKDDVLAAQTKSMKPFEGQHIEIQTGTGTTLWVTNYPPEADEGYLRKLFEEFGEVIEVRFPSLKFNSHRRFCYIQFLTSSQARAATSLHGKDLGEGLKLQAKISDPSVRQDRSGPTVEGREIFIKNLHWGATESEVRKVFEQFGNIQSVRIPRNIAGKSKGAGFVVFATLEEAKAATEQKLQEIRGRAVHVEMSKANAGPPKRTAVTIVSNASGSPEPPSENGDVVMREGSTPLPADSPEADTTSTPSGAVQHVVKNHHARTLLLKHVPDTVNDAQIRALMEKHGSLRKITMKIDKGEAMVEFENIADVGKAELAVQGHEIRSGVHLEVGRIDEHKGRQGSVTGGPPGAVKGKGSNLNPNQVRRPGAGPSRRGGLGFKRGGSIATKSSQSITGADVHMNGTEEDKAEHVEDTEKPKPQTTGIKAANGDGHTAAKWKSQDDFRAMMQKKE